MDDRLKAIDPDLLHEACLLASEDGENTEYDRGMAELIVCVTKGLTFDDTETVMGLFRKGN